MTLPINFIFKGVSLVQVITLYQIRNLKKWKGLIFPCKTWVGIFDVGIFLVGTFLGEIHQGKSLMGGSFPGGSLLGGGIFLELLSYSLKLSVE